MSNCITLLGTGTCQLQLQRMATSALIEWNSTRIVYDFGRGVTQRLIERGLRNNDICHIVLSHFHPDHVSDLIPFLQAACWSRIDPRSCDLNIYGPPGVKTMVDRIIKLFDGEALTRPTFRLHVHEINSSSFTIETNTFEWVDLPPAGNHGLKFNMDGVTYGLTGDSSFHQQEIDFLKTCDVAVIDSGHLEENEIIDLASKSQTKKIVCSHLYQELDATKLNMLAQQKGYRGELVVAQDLMKLNY